MASDETNPATESKTKTTTVRKTYWYNMKDVLEAPTCPSCGRLMQKFKMPAAHIKRCFSIKKVGPLYRLYGYIECKCGLLIADNNKAKKLHVCLGEVPAFEPDLSYVPKKSTALPTEETSETTNTLPRLKVSSMKRETAAKPWVRNFVMPLSLETVQIKLRAKPKPRVRNFDMPLNTKQPMDVYVYSISHVNDENVVHGHSNCDLRSTDQNVVLLKKPLLSLPKLQKSTNAS